MLTTYTKKDVWSITKGVFQLGILGTIFILSIPFMILAVFVENILFFIRKSKNKK